MILASLVSDVVDLLPGFSSIGGVQERLTGNPPAVAGISETQ